MSNISLEQLLRSRDERSEFQQKLLKEWQLPLVSFTVNMPGPDKLNDRSLYIFNRGREAIKEALSDKIVFSEERELATGPEGYYIVNMDPSELKKTTCALEDSTELGRLYDIDVIGPSGGISREDLGLEMRRCLICGMPGAACARNRTHSVSELIEAIDGIISRSKGEQP